MAPAISTVTVTPPSDTIGNGDTRQFAAAAFDANSHPVAGAPAPTWASSKTALATISATGLATATTATLAAADSTVITATYTVAAVPRSGTATLTIDPAIHAAARVTITGSIGAGPFTAIGQTQTLTAKAFDSSGGQLSGVSYTWSSSDSTVVQVTPGAAGSPNATVTVIGNGSATITASASGKDGTLAVSVAQQIASLSAAGAPTTLASLGATVKLIALDANAQAIPGGVTFVSCDGTASPPCPAPTIAIVNSFGTATTVANGSGRITASTVLGSGNNLAHADLTVAQAIQQVAVRVAGSSTLTALGQVQQLAGFDARGNIVVRPITWASDANAVATVDSNGNVTAVAQGTAHVTATGPDSSIGGLDIHVDQRVASVSTGCGSAALGAIGSTLQLQALDARGNNVVAPVAWFSDTTAHATVNATGLVTAAANGGANLSASTSGDAGASLAITVAQKAASISPSSPAPLTRLGATAQLSALDANGHAVASGVTWSVCDNTASPPCSPTVASINGSTGLVTALKNGTTRATATSAGGIAFVSFTVAQAISSVSVAPATASVGLRDTQAFTAVAKDSGGSVIAGAPSAGWTSATPSVASIDASSGVATGVVLGGPVTITATLSGFSGAAQLTVTPFTINWSFGEATPVGAASGTGANLTVHVGDRVQRKNSDNGFHSSTSCGSANPPFGCTGGRQAFSWDDPAQSGGTLAAVTFTTVGTFSYCCTPHSCGQMMGTITVVP